MMSTEIIPDRCVASPTLCYTYAAMKLAERARVNIKKVRTEMGWSQDRLAKLCDPPTVYQQIDKLESGERRITLDWLEKIALALGMTPIALLGGEATPGFQLGEQAATEVARTLALVARDGEPAEPGTVQVLALMLQELNVTFSADPQAAEDARAARTAVTQLSRLFGRATN